MTVRHETVPERRCSKCGNEPRVPGQRWGRNCFNAYNREHRPKYRDLSEEAKKKNRARATANVYKRRGHLTPEPCADCGAPDVQMHHEDYDRPLDVIWLCPPCHREREAVPA